MNFVFRIAIENAVLMALATPLVWGISRLLRRPALTHVLWLILLIKLVTPPVYRPLIPLPHRPVDQINTALVQGVVDDPVEHLQIRSVVQPPPTPDTTSALTAPEISIDAGETSPPPSHSVPNFIALIPAVQIIWIAGSFVCLSIALARIARFSRSLRHAHPAPPELQSRVGQLSRRLGLRSAPTVYFIPGSVCPMLWAVGRSPRLLIPTALWGRLDPHERDTIILHELAHWRRRDHWVRWIELAATTVYWWNPLCWWARRELREAEEQCCDAWVLHATGDFKPYANALLRAVEFISTPIQSSTQHKPLPALASGMGQFNHLKRRIFMLKTANIARALSPRALVAALGFSAVLLPLSPSLKGQQQMSPPSQKTVPVVTRSETVTDTPATITWEKGVTFVVGSDDSSSPEDQLKAARKEIQDLRQKLAQAEARLALYKAGEQGTAPKNAAPNGQFVPPSANNNRNSNGQSADHVVLEGDRVVVEAHNDPLFFKQPGIHDGKYRVVVTDEATGRIKEVREIPLPPPAAPQSDRLDKLEAQLRDLLQEVRSIRQQSAPPATHETTPRR